MDQHLSELLQQNMSPVHQALNYPKPPPVMDNIFHRVGAHAPSPYGWMAPGATSMHYNPAYTIGGAISGGQMNYNLSSRSLNSQAIGPYDARSSAALGSQYGNFGAVDPMTQRMMLAEEGASREAASTNIGYKTAFGAISPLTAVKAATMFMPGGVMAHLGMAAATHFIGNPLQNAMLGGSRRLRMSAMHFRNSMGPTEIGANLTDESGRMGHQESQELANKISTLARTEGTFTSKDYLQMTQTMAKNGMLLQSSSIDDIVDKVRKTSKQLKAFAQIIGETDMQEALKKMAELRNTGVADANLNQVAANAKSFARMANVSVNEMTAFGKQMGQMANQAGLSGVGASQYGQMAYGMAAQGANMFTRGQLQQYGGAKGIATTMTQGMLGAQNHVTSDMLMNTLFRNKGKGQFEFDNGMLQQVLKGQVNLADAFNNRMQEINASGGMTQHVQDMQERRGELQDSLAQRVGPMGMQLLMLRQAQALQKSSGGKMSLFTALVRVTGNEEAARQIARISQNPELARAAVESTILENRKRVESNRQTVEAEAGVGNQLKEIMRQTFDFGGGRSIAKWNAARSQEIKDMSMGVYGSNRQFDAHMSMSRQDRDSMAGYLADPAKEALFGGKSMDTGVNSSTGTGSFTTSPFNWTMGYGLQQRQTTEMLGYGAGMMGRMGRFAGGFFSGAAMFDPNRGGVYGGISKIARVPWALAGLVGLDTTSNLHYRSASDIYERAQQGAKDSAGAVSLLEKRGGIGAAAFGFENARNRFLEGMDVNDEFKSKFGGMVSKAMEQTFREGQSLFRDEKIDTKGTREKILEQARKSGLSSDKLRALEARLQGQQGSELMANAIRANIEGQSSYSQKRRRAQLNEHMTVSGMDTKSIEDAYTTSVITGDKLFNTSGTSESSVKTGVLELGRMMHKAGASSENEYKFMLALSRAIASGTDKQEAIVSLAKKYNIPESRAIELSNATVSSLENDVSGHTKLMLRESSAEYYDPYAKKNRKRATDEDVEASASKMFKGREAASRTTMLENMRKRLGDIGIRVDGSKHFGKELDRLASDSDTMSNLLGKGSTEDQRALGKTLQRLRESGADPAKRQAVMSEIMQQLSGDGDTRSGFRVGGAPDAIAKTQVDMAKQLYQFAQANARNTAAFGQFVDQMVAGQHDFKAGAKDIKEAGELFARSHAKPKEKR